MVENRVKRRMVRAYPGTDGRMPSARLGMVRALAARRVDIDAADDLAGGGASTVQVNPRRAVKSCAWRSRSRRFSARLIWCGQLAPANPGVARMWPMLAVHAA